MDKSKQIKSYQTLLWLGLVILAATLAYFFWPTGVTHSSTPVSVSLSGPESAPQPALTTIAPAPTPTPPIPVDTGSDLPPVPTPPPGGVAGLLVPPVEAVGWASNLDGRSHFGFPNIHAGRFDGYSYHGAFQFDLSPIPPGTTILYAAVELTGLEARYLSPGGVWQLHLLDSAIDAGWAELTYEALHQADVDATLSPHLNPANLGGGRTNLLALDSAQIALLAERLSTGRVSFRLDGPSAGDDNLFTWDSGYRGGEALDTRPKLRLVLLPPPAPEYVIVTSTPTPDNVITVAAMAAEATAVADLVGTYTPVPENWVTPIVVTPQPTPANTATAAHQAAAATAEAFLFGPATATPPNLWTATPTPRSNASRVLAAGQVTLADYVIVTSTPTPDNVITVAAMAAEATVFAQTVGTYTPVPENWVTPIVVTPQPSPANQATALYRQAEATAEAFLNGPVVATPVNLWTATPTPVFVSVEGQVATPWATPTPTALPLAIPDSLVGKIAFLSNRSGGPEPLREPLVYIVDPDGGNLAVLTDRAVYAAAVARDQYSADQRFRVFVKEARRFDNQQVPALYFYDYFYNVEEQITHFGAGGAWDPVWSPAREQIAFVSNDSGDDEIWVVNRDGSEPRQLTPSNTAFNAREIGKDTFVPEIDGHPSWSPDGSKIVFWSSRTGHRQIWVMEADGSNLYSLSTTAYDDWNPVWIKYTDPARHPAPDAAGKP
jgi:hypothetical protein